MVSPFGRGFDSLQLHESAPKRGLFRELEGVEPSSNGETGDLILVRHSERAPFHSAWRPPDALALRARPNTFPCA